MNPIESIPTVRVLNEEGKECLRGWYIYHINRQPAPLEDSLKEEDVEHLVAVTASADWNMPTELKLKRISKPYRIEVIQLVVAWIISMMMAFICHAVTLSKESLNHITALGAERRWNEIFVSF